MFNIIIILIFCLPTAFASAETHLKKHEVRLLTWNVFMIPWPIKLTLQKERTDEIIKLLSNTDYDFIFLQEAFDRDFRTQLVQKLKPLYPHMFYLDRPGFLFPFFGSGLFVLSRHPFQLLENIYFTNASGADYFASKGFSLLEVVLPNGKRLQIINTHLQAGRSKSDIRKLQIQQIKEALLKHKKHNLPQIVLGDINIDIKHPDFTIVKNELSLSPLASQQEIRKTNNRRNNCYTVAGSEDRRIDHVLIDPKDFDPNSALSLLKTEFQFGHQSCPLSDHHALEARLIF